MTARMVIKILNIPINIDTCDTIFLGRPEDNLSRTFQFDISEWVDTFGVGEVRLRVNRPGENFSYIANIVLDSNIASWTIEEADVAISGIGAIELQYVVGKTKIKSQKFRTEIGDCIRGSLQETPLPGQSYMSQVFETANDIMNSVSIAKEAADRAEDAAEKAENGGEAFIATYGKTTFEELTEAWEAGKALFCYHGQIMYSLYSANTAGFMFYNITGFYRNTRYCTASGWKTSTQTEYCTRVHAGQHSKNGADPITPNAIGALRGYIRAMYDGEDMDNLTTPGDYSCANAVAKTLNNAAFDVSHFIRVIGFSPDDDRLVQEAYEQNSSNPHRKWRELTATGWSGWKDGSAGTPGKDGFSPTITTDYDYMNECHVITITDVNGTRKMYVYNGEQGHSGVNGKDGYTPVRGKDYWTEADKAEIKGYVDEAILGGAW